jgi:membrane-associated protease RseP (regulator of RpoE activity)
MVNLDTVGRLGQKKLMVLGGSSAGQWVHIFRGAGFLTGLEVVMVSEDLDSSDHMSFQEAGIPAVQLFTGPHQDYHRPSDTVDKIDAAGLVRVAAITREVVEYLAGREERLTPPPRSGEAPPPAAGKEQAGSRRVSLGTIPDFSYSGKGVRLDGVVDRSPAAKAGLRQGDLLLEINRQAVDSLRDLADILRSLSPGDRAIVKYLREGSEVSIEVRLEKR